MTNQTQAQVQVTEALYEISMAIGNSLDLRTMLRESISTILRKLNCAAGGVYMFAASGDSGRQLEKVFSIPRSAERNVTYNRAWEQVDQVFNQHDSDHQAITWPIEGQGEVGDHYYIYTLTDFGALILIKNGEPLSASIIKSLSRLITKLAASCRACVNDQKVNAFITQQSQVLDIRTRAIEASTESMTIADARQPDLPLIYVNATFEKNTGYTSAEVLGKNCRFLQGNDHDQPELNRLRTALKDERDCVVTLRNYRKDGTLFWNELHISVVRDDKGVVTHFLGNQNNVTDQKTGQEALAQSLQETQTRATQLKTVADVSAAISKDLDPTTLLPNVATLTRDRFGLYHAHIYLLNEAENSLDLVAGADQVGMQMVAEGRTIALEQEQSLVARTARKQGGIIVNDVQDDPGFLPHPLLPETRSEMAVPMLIEDRLLGVLDVQANRTQVFSEDSLQVLTTLAGQIAIVLQNARQFERTQEVLAQTEDQARRLNLLHVFATELSQTTTSEEAFRITAKHMPDIVDSNRASVALLNKEETVLEVFTLDGIKGAVVTGTQLPIENTQLGQAVKTQNPIIVSDTLMSEWVDARKLSEAGLRSLLDAPLIVGKDVIGTLNVGSEAAHSYGQREAQLMTQIASMLATTLENRRLFEQTQARATQLEQVSIIEARLAQSTTETEILLAVLAGLPQQPDQIVLQYIDADQNNQPIYQERVAVWRKGAVLVDDPDLGLRQRFDDFELNQQFVEHPNKIVFVSDVLTDTRIDQNSQTLFAKFGVSAFAAIPLQSSNRWQGLLSLDWETPHEFNADEKFIYGQFMEAAAAIVLSRRSTLAQQKTLDEANALYRISNL
ncbi:MAG: GAF domain-containing protein, partial [Chloroflexota bacterium]